MTKPDLFESTKKVKYRLFFLFQQINIHFNVCSSIILSNRV